MRGRCAAGFILGVLLGTAVACRPEPAGRPVGRSADTSLTGGSWALVTLAGRPVDSGPVSTLRFGEEGSLSGFDGCNRYRGTFSTDGSNLHIERGMATTMAACDEPLASRAGAYAQALERVSSFGIARRRLSLRDAGGYEVAGFEAASAPLAGSSWTITAYNNGKQGVVSVLIGTDITARFGDDGRVSGSAGCNQYVAAFETSDESISIGLPGSTRRFCTQPDGVMVQEERFLQALRSAATFLVEGDRLYLRTVEDSVAVNLLRVGSEPSSQAPETKIRFDLNRINPDGLHGPPDGLRALHYEYCIPDRPEVIKEVASIDPTLEIHRGARGRVGCGPGELLCLGHTHQPGYGAVLKRLEAHSSIAAIHEAFFE